ncbi:hypothetical protein D9M70_527390 [compost metagenome]
MGADTAEGLLQLVVGEHQGIGQGQAREHGGVHRMGVQHRAYLRLPAVELGVQQGFRRGLLARLQAVAVEIRGQHVVRAELALVLAGNGQQRFRGGQARGVIAAGGRRPAAVVQEASGFDDFLGELLAVHARSSCNRVAMITAAASAARLAMT